MSQLDALLAVAIGLTGVVDSGDRHRRLLEAIGKAIPYDAATLMRLEGDELVPLVAVGLSDDALGRRFVVGEHPRLDIICKSDEPVHFPVDTDLPDPFDGLLVNDAGRYQRIHACLGWPLRVDGELIGALTADALDHRAFDGIEPRFLATLGALAAAVLRTTDLLGALERSAERQGQIARDLMRDVLRREGSELLGTSPAMHALRQEIDIVAGSDLTVLINGETGTGKELVARAVHAASDRREEPMLYVNCAALPETLAESELFGHVRGAFTGANADRPGKFEVADGGTLMLDEIGELSLAVQPKLLRALQEGDIQRVGTDKSIRVNVRVLAATNRDLEAEVTAGRFRADLFHRINVYGLRIPPLRERGKDIALLAGHFCDEARRRLAVGPVRLDATAAEFLLAYPWPGNVRELKNLLSRVTLKAAVGVPRGEPVIITPEHLGPDFGRQTSRTLAPADEPMPSEELGMKEAVRVFQRRRINRALANSAGNWAAAARVLGMHRSNLHHLATRLGLK